MYETRGGLKMSFRNSTGIKPTPNILAESRISVELKTIVHEKVFIEMNFYELNKSVKIWTYDDSLFIGILSWCVNVNYLSNFASKYNIKRYIKTFMYQ